MYTIIVVVVVAGVLVRIGSLWTGEIPPRRSRYVDPTAVRIVVVVTALAGSMCREKIEEKKNEKLV